MSYEARLFLCIAAGFTLGLLMGWFAWRLPMSRDITLSEAYIVLRMCGSGWFASGLLAVIWWARGVQARQEER